MNFGDISELQLFSKGFHFDFWTFWIGKKFFLSSKGFCLFRHCIFLENFNFTRGFSFWFFNVSGDRKKETKTLAGCISGNSKKQKKKTFEAQRFPFLVFFFGSKVPILPGLFIPTVVSEKLKTLEHWDHLMDFFLVSISGYHNQHRIIRFRIIEIFNLYVSKTSILRRR